MVDRGGVPLTTPRKSSIPPKLPIALAYHKPPRPRVPVGIRVAVACAIATLLTWGYGCVVTLGTIALQTQIQGIALLLVPAGLIGLSFSVRTIRRRRHSDRWRGWVAGALIGIALGTLTFVAGFVFVLRNLPA